MAWTPKRVTMFQATTLTPSREPLVMTSAAPHSTALKSAAAMPATAPATMVTATTSRT